MARSLLQASKEDLMTLTSGEVLDFEDETLKGKKNTCNHVTAVIINNREIPKVTCRSSLKVASR